MSKMVKGMGGPNGLFSNMAKNINPQQMAQMKEQMGPGGGGMPNMGDMMSKMMAGGGMQDMMSKMMSGGGMQDMMAKIMGGMGGPP
jgi:signal recognition particle GTPase